MTTSTTEFTNLSTLDRDALTTFATTHKVEFETDATDEELREAIVAASLDENVVVSNVDLVGSPILTTENLAGLKKSQLKALADARGIEYDTKTTVDGFVENIVGNVKATTSESEASDEAINGAQALFAHANPDGLDWENVQVAVRERYIEYAEVVLGA